MALRDRVNLPRSPVVGSVLLAVAWVGLSALFSSVGLIDWIVAVGLVVGGVLRQRTSRPRTEDDKRRGIYGPP